MSHLFVPFANTKEYIARESLRHEAAEQLLCVGEFTLTYVEDCLVDLAERIICEQLEPNKWSKLQLAGLMIKALLARGWEDKSWPLAARASWLAAEEHGFEIVEV
jgi:hypothetical protein